LTLKALMSEVWLPSRCAGTRWSTGLADIDPRHTVCALWLTNFEGGVHRLCLNNGRRRCISTRKASSHRIILTPRVSFFRIQIKLKRIEPARTSDFLFHYNLLSSRSSFIFNAYSSRVEISRNTSLNCKTSVEHLVKLC